MDFPEQSVIAPQVAVLPHRGGGAKRTLSRFRYAVYSGAIDFYVAVGAVMDITVEKCDLCIVGAGLAGINALFVASRHLTRDQRVILVDRRGLVGGMWVDTYPYVHLHQPHPMFTAGNIKWTLQQPPAYLASKGEVLGHFQHCLDALEKQLTVDEFFGWTMESDDESPDGVQVVCRSADGRVMRIETKHLIKAYGFRVDPNDPLAVSSSQVRSVSPDTCDVRSSPIADSTAPVWIIGGGKTAMDTAHALITTYPGREINLMAGSGTFFHEREKFFPDRRHRWWTGTMVSTLAAEISKRFDGTNEDELWDWHRARYGLWSTPQSGNFLLGVLSKAENDTIRAGLSQAINDHLVDVVDTAAGPQMMLRSGESRPIAPDSWLVNCTGYITHRRFPYEPFRSPGGRVLSIQSSSATLHLSSYMAYFSTHLLLSGKLGDVPLYELDILDLYEKARKAFPYTLMTLVELNLGLCLDSLPSKAFRECGLDFDRWYPLPRQLFATARFVRNHRREREHLRHTLDTVHDRFGVRCGPLQSAAPTAA